MAAAAEERLWAKASAAYLGQGLEHGVLNLKEVKRELDKHRRNGQAREQAALAAFAETHRSPREKSP